MKKLVKIVFLSLGLLITNKSIATNLQGQVISSNGYQYVPVSGIRVDIWVFNGTQWVDWSYSVTNANGMYYFGNMSPGVNFQIQINGRFCFTQPLFLSNAQMLNIPQIVI